jgi:hypothetical protein
MYHNFNDSESLHTIKKKFFSLINNYLECIILGKIICSYPVNEKKYFVWDVEINQYKNK